MVRSCHIFTDIRPQALAPPSWNDCSRTASFATGSCLSLFCYSTPATFYTACSLSNRNLFTQSKKVIKCQATSWSLSEQSPGPEVDPAGEAWLMVSGRLRPPHAGFPALSPSAAETVWGLWFLLQEPRDPCAVLTLAPNITLLVFFTMSHICFHFLVFMTKFKTALLKHCVCALV